MNTANEKWIRTGISLVDEQHNEYFRRLDVLMEKLDSSGLNGYALRGSLDYFRSFALVHFDTEEMLMKISSFPEFGEHALMHDFFREYIERMSGDLDSTREVSRIAYELKSFLSGWLENHIMRYDVKMTDHLKAKIKDAAACTR